MFKTGNPQCISLEDTRKHHSQVLVSYARITTYDFLERDVFIHSCRAKNFLFQTFGQIKFILEALPPNWQRLPAACTVEMVPGSLLEI